MVKTTKIVTPVGTSSWCSINPDNPDTKFEHQWYVDLIVDKADAQDFLKTVKAFYAETKADFGEGKPTNPIPITNYVDEDGNATDKVLIKCKRKVGGVRKDGTAWTNQPHVLFDTDMQKFVPEGNLGKGTKMRVSLAMKPYSKPKVGVTFEILSCLIIEPEYYGVQASADDFGIEAVAPSGGEGQSALEAGGDDFNF